eukprot:2715981-Prymnesium_polylepis.1
MKSPRKAGSWARLAVASVARMAEGEEDKTAAAAMGSVAAATAAAVEAAVTAAEAMAPVVAATVQEAVALAEAATVAPQVGAREAVTEARRSTRTRRTRRRQYRWLRTAPIRNHPHPRLDPHNTSLQELHAGARTVAGKVAVLKATGALEAVTLG